MKHNEDDKGGERPREERGEEAGVNLRFYNTRSQSKKEERRGRVSTFFCLRGALKQNGALASMQR